MVSTIDHRHSQSWTMVIDGTAIPQRCGVGGKLGWLGLCLCRHFAKRDAQCLGHPLAISRISLQAVADVADLNLPRRGADCAGGVGEQHRLLVGAHQTEEQAGLGVDALG